MKLETSTATFNWKSFLTSYKSIQHETLQLLEFSNNVKKLSDEFLDLCVRYVPVPVMSIPDTVSLIIYLSTPIQLLFVEAFVIVCSCILENKHVLNTSKWSRMLIRMKLTKLTKNSRIVHFQLESKNSPNNFFLELSSHLGSSYNSQSRDQEFVWKTFFKPF